MAETVKPGRNGFDPEKANKFVEAIEEQDDKIAEIMADAREACQPHKDQIKDIKNTAAEEGFAKKPLNAVLAKRKHLRKADNADVALNDGQKDDFEQIQHALGMLAETPLGQSALQAA